MPEYAVAWAIEIDANSPEEAARKAKATMQDPDTIADSFVVSLNEPGAPDEVVDLSLLDGRTVD